MLDWNGLGVIWFDVMGLASNGLVLNGLDFIGLD